MESLDDIFALFTNERRRFALYYLDNADGAVSIDELAEKIHEWEDGPSDSETAYETYEDVMITLKHNHLPAIKNADHVEYDSTDQELRITGLSAEADVILSVTEAIEQPSQTEDVILERLG